MSLPWYMHTNPVSWIFDRAFNPSINTNTEIGVTPSNNVQIPDTFGGQLGQGLGEGLGSGLKWALILGLGFLAYKATK